MVLDNYFNGDETEAKEKIQLARLRMAQHRYSDAKAVIEEILPQYPDNPIVLDIYSIALFWLEDSKGSLEIRRKLIDMNPSNAGNYFIRDFDSRLLSFGRSP